MYSSKSFFPWHARSTTRVWMENKKGGGSSFLCWVFLGHFSLFLNFVGHYSLFLLFWGPLFSIPYFFGGHYSPETRLDLLPFSFQANFRKFACTRLTSKCWITYWSCVYVQLFVQTMAFGVSKRWWSNHVWLPTTLGQLVGSINHFPNNLSF